MLHLEGTSLMTSTLGGDDPSYDLTPEEKDRLERRLREEARKLLGGKNRKELINERGRDMPPAITAIASPSLRKRYKDLLRSNWSSSSLESVLALLWDEIKGSADASGFAWWSMLQL